MNRLVSWAVAVGCVGALASGTAAAEPESCGAAGVAAAIPATTPVEDWAENVGYDAAGNLWVSRLLRNEVQRYDRAGRITATAAVASPGAIVRFDPAAAEPRPPRFAGGLAMPNGAAFDAAGNLYIADTTTGVVKIPRWPTRRGRLSPPTSPPARRSRRCPTTSPSAPITPSTTPPPPAAWCASTPRRHTACVLYTGLPLTAVAIDPSVSGKLAIGTKGGDILPARLSAG